MFIIWCLIGLPSQLRDAVLSEYEGKSLVPESEVGQEYYLNQQIVALNNGEDAWASRDNPNERLLKMARTVMKDREQPRVKLPVSTSSSMTTSDSALSMTEGSGKRSHRYDIRIYFYLVSLLACFCIVLFARLNLFD